MGNSSFDNAAAAYDKDFTTSEIGRLQRNSVWGFLKKKVLQPPPQNILEINCGTGADAIWLAENGYQVSACDASAKMIEQSEIKKITIPGLSVTFKQVDFLSLQKHYANATFDLVFSNFGGLNCIDKIEMCGVITNLSRLCKPKGELVLVIMGRFCLWESFYFLLKGNPRSAFRRRSRNAVPASIAPGITQNTWYYSPGEMKKLAAKEFNVIDTKGVGLFVPPSYIEKFFSNKKYLLRVLTVFDTLLCRFSFTSSFSDHFILHLRKK